MQKWRQWETAYGEEWELALEREAVIRPLASKSKLSVTLVEEATRQLQLAEACSIICCAATNSGHRHLPFFPGRDHARAHRERNKLLWRTGELIC
jgi:hypothetical protein